MLGNVEKIRNTRLKIEFRKECWFDSGQAPGFSLCHEDLSTA
jgi:hypothetical protein